MRDRVVQDTNRKTGDHVRNGHWAEARDIFARLCEADRAEVESWVGFMHAHLQLGGVGRARSHGEPVLRIEPRAFDVMLNVGGLCAADGKFDLAGQSCLQAVREKWCVWGAAQRPTVCYAEP